MRYSLAPYSYLRLGERGVLWLNVRSDRYIGQHRSAVRGLGSIVKGWRSAVDDEATADISTANAERLVARELLIPGDSGRSAEPPALPIPSASLRPDRRLVSPCHILRFRAACRTINEARNRSLEFVLDHTRERKGERAWRESDMERTQRLVNIFRRMRALSYGPHNECLKDSLTLMEFLAAYELHPTLVMGVRVRPFAAHCWVQAEGVVLTDHESTVQRYSPILAI